MAENKTQPTRQSVAEFFNSIEDEQKRRDAKKIDKLFREVSGEKPVMWGPSIVGYGTYHYEYASGREGDFMRLGFSPRKQSLTLYIMPGFKRYDALLKGLGKHSTGKSCLYVKRLEEIDFDVLRTLAEAAWAEMDRKYPPITS
jgi:hypothetical protein